jgi:hypothetical protein
MPASPIASSMNSCDIVTRVASLNGTTEIAVDQDGSDALMEPASETSAVVGSAFWTGIVRLLSMLDTVAICRMTFA